MARVIHITRYRQVPLHENVSADKNCFGNWFIHLRVTGNSRWQFNYSAIGIHLHVRFISRNMILQLSRNMLHLSCIHPTPLLRNSILFILIWFGKSSIVWLIPAGHVINSTECICVQSHFLKRIADPLCNAQWVRFRKFGQMKTK